MKKVLVFIGLLVFISAFITAQAQESSPQLAWNPANTLVFVVGLLKWQNSDDFVSFPAKNRRDVQLVNFFKKAGVPDANLTYLQDEAATLAAIRRSLNQTLKASQPGQTLIIYFEGHGYADEDEDAPVYFANYDAETGGVGGWPAAELISKIESGFKGDRVILMADCCLSGELVHLVKKNPGRLSYACFGSAQRDKSSTENWTFTEAILSAFRGSGPADIDHDGVVTMKEMRMYIRSEMAFAEGQKSVSALTGEWKPADVLAKARPLRTAREGEHVQVYSEEDWWTARIVDEKDGKYKVFYYGYENEDDEWVSPKQMRIPKALIEKVSSQMATAFGL